MDLPSRKRPAPPLARNSACHQCRTRKLKCDGTRPLCNNCSKPRVRNRGGGLTSSSGCTWDEMTVPGGGWQHDALADEGEAASTRELAGLEERIALYETLLGTQVALLGAPPSRSSTSLQAPGSNNRSPFPFIPDLAGLPSLDQANALSDVFAQQPSDVYNIPQAPSVGTPFEWVDRNLGGAALLVDVNFDWDGSLATTDWPQELPPLETVIHIIYVFFDRVATWPKMLRKAAVLQNVHRSPTHKLFPSLPLLHAILCITAPHLPSSSLSSPTCWPTSTPYYATQHPDPTYTPLQDYTKRLPNPFGTTQPPSPPLQTPLSRFQAYHKSLALFTMSQNLHSGTQWLQILQSMILISATDQLNMDFADMWLHSGTCIRMAIPLRLYEADHGSVDEVNLTGFGEKLRLKAKDEVEQCEMDRTWWMAYLLDRSIAVWTDRPTTLPEEEITVGLPVLQEIYELGMLGQMKGNQTILGVDLYTNHPALHQDPLVLYIKALKLFNDTHAFFRVYQRRPHTTERYINDVGYRLLLSQVTSFRMGIPKDLRRPTRSLTAGEQLDRELLISAMYILATSLILANPMITEECWKGDVAEMGLVAIRGILSLIYDINATSYDITLLPASFPFIVVLAAKGLIRFVGLSEGAGDMGTAGLYRSEVDVFRMVLMRYGERHPLGGSLQRRIEGFLRNQDHINREEVRLRQLDWSDIFDIAAAATTISGVP